MSLDYVTHYDNSLDANLCDEIIRRFESDTKNQIITSFENVRNFTEINISESFEWADIHDKLLDTMQEYLQVYRDEFKIDTKVWPEQIGFEMFRMKRYLPNNQDDFKFHVDVGSYASARRFLVYFWYLNDVEEGGETVFYNANETQELGRVNPKKGRLLMFPPLWTHPHAGLKPISNAKYIIGGYLHYI